MIYSTLVYPIHLPTYLANPGEFVKAHLEESSPICNLHLAISVVHLSGDFPEVLPGGARGFLLDSCLVFDTPGGVFSFFHDPLALNKTHKNMAGIA